MKSFVRACPYARSDVSAPSYGRVRTTVATRPYEAGNPRVQIGW
ncbi:hypothetical protein [Bacteroides sp. Marseille-P3684]|nr:hypothetical protein [Bacteroides sp. Marseille-P3684]